MKYSKQQKKPGSGFVNAANDRMKRVRVLSGGLILSALLAPAAVIAHPFVGEWLATAQAPGGDVSEKIMVTETDNGYVITAKLVEGPQAPNGSPEAGPGTDIVLEGDSFSYKRSLGDFVISYSGTVSGDEFTGTVDMGFSQVPYNGVRVGRE